MERDRPVGLWRCACACARARVTLTVARVPPDGVEVRVAVVEEELVSGAIHLPPQQRHEVPAVDRSADEYGTVDRSAHRSLAAGPSIRHTSILGGHSHL